MSAIAAAVSRSELSHRATVSQDAAHPQFLLPHVWDISIFSAAAYPWHFPFAVTPDEHFRSL